MANFIEQALEKQEQAREALRKSTELSDALNLLPEALTEHDWGEGVSVEISEWWNSIELDLRLSGGAPNQDTVDTIKEYLGKEVGFSFESVRHEYAESFCYTGKLEGFTVDGKGVSINLGRVPKPQNCRLVKKLVTKQVEVYEAICKDTGQPI